MVLCQSCIVAMRNKIAARCAACDTHLAAGAGWSRRDFRRGWLSACDAPACLARAGFANEVTAAPAAADTRRELNAAGEVRVPYRAGDAGEAERAILRAMPGSRWDRDARCYRVSLAAQDRPRLLELADRLKLEVAAELRAGAPGTSVAAALAPEAAAAGERARAVGAYAYQVAGVEWLALRARALLADDMGCGKTMQALLWLPEAAECRAVVVCPKSVARSWERECRRWRPDLRPVVAAKGSWRLPEPGEVLVTHYEALPAPAALGSVEALAPLAVVLDEAHRCKSYRPGYTDRDGKEVAAKGAQRAVRAAHLARSASRALALTGTPLLNQPFELRAVLELVGAAYEAFGGFPRFVRLFQGSRDRFGGYTWGTPLPEVPELLRRVALRRTKAEVLGDLPPKVRTRRPVELTGALRKAADAAWGLWGSYGVDDETGLPDALPPFTEFSRIRAQLAESRIPAMLDRVEDYEDAGKPLLVFSAHRAPVDALADREGWATITGDTPGDRRDEVVQEFQAGKLKGVALTITAGGVGLTLTRASDVLFVDRDWVPANNLQAEDRVHRIGQKGDAVQIEILESDHALDRHVQDLLDAKTRLIEAAVEAQVKVTPATATAGKGDSFASRIEAVRAAAREAEVAAAKAAIEKRGAGVAKRANGHHVKRDLTPERKATIADAIRRLADQCDGAETRDGVGFSKSDQALGHWFVATDFEGLSDDLWEIADKFCTIYRRQLGAGA